MQMKRKIFIWAITATGFIIAGFYGVHEYFRPNSDMHMLKEMFRTNSISLIHEFCNNDSIAGKKYFGKIIIMQGNLKNIEIDEKKYYTLVLGDDSNMSSVRCNMDTLYTKEYTGLQIGKIVFIKGIVIGYNSDPTGLLGSDIQLNRCILQK